MSRDYAEGLSLNKTEQEYRRKLEAFNWLYFLSGEPTVYTAGKVAQRKLKAVADTKKGNYQILYQRVEADRVRVPATVE